MINEYLYFQMIVSFSLRAMQMIRNMDLKIWSLSKIAFLAQNTHKTLKFGPLYLDKYLRYHQNSKNVLSVMSQILVQTFKIDIKRN